MVQDVGAAGNLRIDLHQIGIAARFFQETGSFQLIADSHDIHRLLLHVQCLYSLEDNLMAFIIETFWFQNLSHLSPGLLLYHQSAYHSHLHIQALRLLMSILVHTGDFHNLCRLLSSLSHLT